MKFGDWVQITSNNTAGVVLDRILPTSINNYMDAYLIATMEGLVLVEPSQVSPLGFNITDEL